jgi:hypothetical protein
VPQGSCSIIPGDSSKCSFSRGTLWNYTQSSTWTVQGTYKLGLDSNVNYIGTGEYGFDSVGLGFDNSSGPQLEHQVVAAISSQDFWLGVFGIGFQPTKFTVSNSQPSFAQSLLSNKLIPSRSWSYTAGAKYRKQTCNAAHE